MEKINYVESPSYGVTRALFFKGKSVRIHGNWYPLRNKKVTSVYGGTERMTLLVQTEPCKAERLYLYKNGDNWILDNNVSFFKKTK